MEEMNISHCDIKPHNILVKDDLELKIAGFSLAEIRDSDPDDRIHLVQGTIGYMSPELQHYFDRGIQTAAFSRRKADVFSLGLVIFQMYTQDALDVLNLARNHQRLRAKLDLIQVEWLRVLLLKMLSLDPDERESFKYLLGYIPLDGEFTL